ncbi:MAG: phosphatidate cytidylyltransferase, partial [Candidatus Bipolaricaulia bacterium]
PEISPGKTVEGALGSIIGTAALALLFSYTLPWLSYPFVVLLGVIISITGQLGDLVISVIKRDIGVKDASRLIPGHGGLLDRTDSLIFTVPIAYFYLIGLCGC